MNKYLPLTITLLAIFLANASAKVGAQSADDDVQVTQAIAR